MPNPANKKTIAVDIDDVIAAENDGVREFINLEYGEKHSVEDYLVDGEYWGYWESVWDIGDEEAKKRFDAYLASDVKDNLKLVDGAGKAIRRLKKSHRLVIVTSRYGRQLETTEPWLEKHFRKTFDGVAFVGTWDKNREITKAIIAREIGADYLIDDNAEHCNLAAKAGIQALLFGDYGWNRNTELHPKVKRLKNWQQVLEYFDGQ